MQVCESAEFLKLALLVKHCLQHKYYKESLGVLSFLNGHYNYENDCDKNSKEDQQMLFKSSHPTLSKSLITLPTATFAFIFCKQKSYQYPYFKKPGYFGVRLNILRLFANLPKLGIDLPLKSFLRKSIHFIVQPLCHNRLYHMSELFQCANYKMDKRNLPYSMYTAF